jgi:hypothetical protein
MEQHQRPAIAARLFQVYPVAMLVLQIDVRQTLADVRPGREVWGCGAASGWWSFGGIRHESVTFRRFAREYRRPYTGLILAACAESRWHSATKVPKTTNSEGGLPISERVDGT